MRKQQESIEAESLLGQAGKRGVLEEPGQRT